MRKFFLVILLLGALTGVLFPRWHVRALDYRIEKSGSNYEIFLQSDSKQGKITAAQLRLTILNATVLQYQKPGAGASYLIVPACDGNYVSGNTVCVDLAKSGGFIIEGEPLGSIIVQAADPEKISIIKEAGNAYYTENNQAVPDVATVTATPQPVAPVNPDASPLSSSDLGLVLAFLVIIFCVAGLVFVNKDFFRREKYSADANTAKAIRQNIPLTLLIIVFLLLQCFHGALPVHAVTVSPASGNAAPNSTATIQIFAAPPGAGYTSVQLRLDFTNMTVTGYTPPTGGNFQSLPACSGSVYYLTTSVCADIALTAGTVTTGMSLGSVTVTFAATGTGTISKNANNAYYTSANGGTLTPDTGTAGTYTITGSASLPATGILEDNPGLLAGIFLLLSGLFIRKRISESRKTMILKQMP